MIVKLCKQGKQYTDTLDDSPVMVMLPFRFHSVTSQRSHQLRRLRGILTADYLGPVFLQLCGITNRNNTTALLRWP
jgi:hypothetical protein